MLVINKRFRLTCREQDVNIINEIFKKLDVDYHNKRYSAIANDDNFIMVTYMSCSCKLENYKTLCNMLQESPVRCSITEGTSF